MAEEGTNWSVRCRICLLCALSYTLARTKRVDFPCYGASRNAPAAKGHDRDGYAPFAEAKPYSRGTACGGLHASATRSGTHPEVAILVAGRQIIGAEFRRGGFILHFPSAGREPLPLQSLPPSFSHRPSARGFTAFISAQSEWGSPPFSLEAAFHKAMTATSGF